MTGLCLTCACGLLGAPAVEAKGGRGGRLVRNPRGVHEGPSHRPRHGRRCPSSLIVDAVRSFRFYFFDVEGAKRCFEKRWIFEHNCPLIFQPPKYVSGITECSLDVVASPLYNLSFPLFFGRPTIRFFLGVGIAPQLPPPIALVNFPLGNGIWTEQVTPIPQFAKGGVTYMMCRMSERGRFSMFFFQLKIKGNFVCFSVLKLWPLLPYPTHQLLVSSLYFFVC